MTTFEIVIEQIMIEIMCPVCNQDCILAEVDEADNVTQYAVKCSCGSLLTLLVTEEDNDDA